MFHSIPPSVKERMRYLEAIDARDRENGTPRMQRLRQVTPDVGQFIALLAAAAPDGDIIEIGTSAGYSTLWLAMACRANNRRMVTFEVLPEKVALAQETFRLAGVEDVVELVQGDARTYLSRNAEQHAEHSAERYAEHNAERYAQIAFCFLDAEKEVYGECYELVVPRLVKGGLLVADNAINHREVLQPMLDRALQDERVDALIIPIGKGELFCRKI